MFQLSKMYRGPHVLTSCPVRNLLCVVRNSQFRALPEHTCRRWNSRSAAGAILSSQRNRRTHRRGQRNEDNLLSKETLSFSSCRRCQTKAVSFQNLMSIASLSISSQRPQDFASSKPKLLGPSLVYETLRCTFKVLAHNPKAQSTYHDCSNNLLKRPQDMSCHPTSVSTKSQCPQSHIFHKEHFSSAIRYLTHRMWPSSLSMLPNRALHQAAFSEAAILRDCLSLETEERCRQSLRPNLKLYEDDKGRRDVGQSQGRWASVLVSLCSVKGEPAFLFTLRSSTLKGRHKGDVSFAGGKRDPSDNDVVATALREAQEELGVTVETEKVWGILKPLRDRSGMLIAPVLANLGAVESLYFKPNPGEVEEIFTLSLSHVCNPLNRGYTHFRTGDKYGYTLPVFRNGKHRVWGLTAIALDNTLKLIVPP